MDKEHFDNLCQSIRQAGQFRRLKETLEEIEMTPKQAIEFLKQLAKPVKLTPAQRKLSKLMQGKGANG